MSKEDRISLKELEIVFENCDSVVISGDYINNLYLGDIVESIRIFHSKEVDNYRMAKDVYICISLKLKRENFLTEFKENAWKRLVKGKDITQIHLIYSDDSKESFFVDWNEESEFSNIYQIVTFDRLSLKIVINRHNRNKDLFISKRDLLLNQIDLYNKDLSKYVIDNAKILVNQLRTTYLPDEIYLTDESNKEFLRFNWYEDYLNVFMVDVYLDRIEIKLFLRNESGEVEEFYKLIYPEDIKINSIIEDYLSCKENEVPQYRIANGLNFNKKED